jgi:26-hydroxylase
MEQRIQLEVGEFLNVINDEYNNGHLSEDNAMDLTCVVAASATNVISSVLMSVRYKPGDTDFQRFMHLMDEGFRLFTIAAKVNVFPILRFLPRMAQAYDKLKQVGYCKLEYRMKC